MASNSLEVNFAFDRVVVRNKTHMSAIGIPLVPRAANLESFEVAFKALFAATTLDCLDDWSISRSFVSELRVRYHVNLIAVVYDRHYLSLQP